MREFPISDFRFPIDPDRRHASAPSRAAGLCTETRCALKNSAAAHGKSEIGNRKSEIIKLAALAILLLYGLARAAERSPHEIVADANKQLAAGEYQKALDAYHLAEVSLPDAPELAYNQGIARYRLKDYAKARAQFLKALSTRDLALEGKAKYNLGNCAYAEALQKLSDVQAAIDGLRQAINHYRDALEIDPKDNDARANIETAQLLIKDLLDKQKQQQEQQKQQQDQQKQDQEKNPQSQPSSQPSEPQDQKQQQEQQQDKEQKDKQQQEQQSQDQQKQQEQKQQDQQQPGEKRAMTQQEAERLMQAVRDREKEHQDKQARRVRARRVAVEKDW